MKIQINKTAESSKSTTAQMINMAVNYLLEKDEASVRLVSVKIRRGSTTKKLRELKIQNKINKIGVEKPAADCAAQTGSCKFVCRGAIFPTA